MCKVIAVLNEKGGVSKTTMVKNLSVGLAKDGYKTLAIDLDPSASLTKVFLKNPNCDEKGSICEIIEDTIEMEDIPEGYGITHLEEGTDLIMSSMRLHATESKLQDAMQKEIVLRRYVETIKNKYDVVLLDCPAGLGIFVVNALFCADSILIPLEPHYTSGQAIQNVFLTIKKVRKLNGTGDKPEILGAVFSKVRLNTRNDRAVMTALREQTGQHVHFFDTYIPLSAKITESDAAHASIFKYAPNSPAAMMYQDFIDELKENGLKKGAE